MTKTIQENRYKLSAQQLEHINQKYYMPYEDDARFTGANIEEFIYWCTKKGASDINIQSEEYVKCEINGRLYTVTRHRLTKADMINFVTKIYGSDGGIAKLNGGEDIDMPWSLKKDKVTYRFRVNITAILAEGMIGYAITIRTITNRAPALETLNLPEEIIDNIAPEKCMIVLIGSTGSGKSTLLASVLDWRMRDPEAHLKILTYEAPIEYVYDDVPKPTSIISQSEIGRGKNLPSFEAAVRNALRRKPSIIELGEMRDRETIGEGITAAMTGHLVYGTLHANGVADAIRRMVNVFDPSEKNQRAMDILSSIKLIVGQELLPSTDGKRVAIREYLSFDEEITDALMDVDLDNLTSETRKILKMKGRTFLQDATEKFEKGMISEKVYKNKLKTYKAAEKDLSNKHNENEEDRQWV